MENEEAWLTERDFYDVVKDLILKIKDLEDQLKAVESRAKIANADTLRIAAEAIIKAERAESMAVKTLKK